MRIATWNVNSITSRLPRVLEWLESAQPDVVALQELKCTSDAFPHLPIQALGYEAVVLPSTSPASTHCRTVRTNNDSNTGWPQRVRAFDSTL